MLTNSCFYVFGDAFRVLHFYCTNFQAIFLFNNFFYQQTFNTTLSLTGAYNMSLKKTKCKQQWINGKKKIVIRLLNIDVTNQANVMAKKLHVYSKLVDHAILRDFL